MAFQLKPNPIPSAAEVAYSRNLGGSFGKVYLPWEVRLRKKINVVNKTRTVVRGEEDRVERSDYWTITFKVRTASVVRIGESELAGFGKKVSLD